MNIRVKKLHSKAVLPIRGSEHAAGYDLTSVGYEIFNSEGYGYIEYQTGLAIMIPTGYVGLLFPRSSVSKTGLILANCVGVIDSDYRGEIKARFKWIQDTTRYNVGDRVCQLIIIKYEELTFEEVEELEQTARATSGFGSTGN